ncbi:septum formation initiator family protein [Arthrobacter sp. ISL-30]|uniref:FtsB family cell division protein n=1 Tax=Arthrobacter sp. ISL-30 TaxID=2819109 RepID=UPI001BE8165C|nr:septum formation initiator family protein [Arthrobacter sp. ISL-30]MBT2515127.1 septum formation initiator family protein [Arthrobacter sp. ISL-30]
MATRRPKVPKASALSGQPRNESDGGDVIRADFGAGRGASAGTGKPGAGDSGVKPHYRATPNRTAPNRTAPNRTDLNERTAPNRTAAGARTTAEAGTTWKAGTTSNPGTRNRGEDHAPVPARAFSGRMLALAVVMIAITVMLAPTVKIFFEKRAEIAALEDEIASRKSEQEDLRRQVSRWQDPNYVKQQARDRINMVMPGETSYWVFGGEETVGTARDSTGTGASGNPANLPWVDALWESIRRSATD